MQSYDFEPEKVIARLLRREHGSEKYVVEDKVAQGGMGAIYRAQDQDLKRMSVLKVILPGVMEDALLFRRFIEEAQITGQLEHPNIIPVHELGVLGGSKLYFTMKLVEGEALGSILKNVRDNIPGYVERYSRYTLLTIFRKVCDAVAFAHSKNVIHRDIKPDNIMVGEYGEVLLMDWGLARREDRDEEEAETAEDDENDEEYDDDDEMKTRFGVVKGTPAYMSPEQARGAVDEIDHRSDIYLLGTTLYAIATMQVPFTGGDIYEILANAENGNFIEPGRRAPEREIPQELCRIIMKAMAFRREDRYQNVEELNEDLDNLMAGNTVSVRRTFRKGEYIMQEGEPGYEAYVIISGKVEVSKTIRGKSVQLITLSSGDIIGEMALILKAPRSASVRATEDTEVVIITAETMRQGLGQLPPWMGKVVDSLAERLRKANANVHPLMSGNCVYHVLNQLRLVYSYWGEPMVDHESNMSAVVINTDKTIREIATNLGITKERVSSVVSQLIEHNLFTPHNKDSFYMSNFELFNQLVDFSHRSQNIETIFETDSRTSLLVNDNEFIVRHSSADTAGPLANLKPVVLYPADELIGARSPAEKTASFDSIYNKIREVLESAVKSPAQIQIPLVRL